MSARVAYKTITAISAFFALYFETAACRNIQSNCLKIEKLLWSCEITNYSN